MNNTAQGSDAWIAARLGKLTASRISEATARTRTGWGASRANLMASLMVERLTGQPAESYTNDAMKYGTETEPQARSAYSFITDNDVAQVGFIDHPTIAMSGASPDGFIGADGLLEIKCPNTATHIDFLLTGKVPDKYLKQMCWQMACSRSKWCDFVSFDPRLPVDLQIKIVRYIPTPDEIAELEKQARDFLKELDAKLESLTKLRKAA